VRLAEVLECGDDHRQTKSADENVEDAGHVAKRQRTLDRSALRHAPSTQNTIHTWPIHGSTCARRHPQLRTGGFVRGFCCLTATSAFGLKSFPQRCYLHRLCIVTTQEHSLLLARLMGQYCFLHAVVCRRMSSVVVVCRRRRL